MAKRGWGFYRERQDGATHAPMKLGARTLTQVVDRKETVRVYGWMDMNDERRAFIPPPLARKYVSRPGACR